MAILLHYASVFCTMFLMKKSGGLRKNIIKFQHYGWYGVLGLPFK